MKINDTKQINYLDKKKNGRFLYKFKIKDSSIYIYIYLDFKNFMRLIRL